MEERSLSIGDLVHDWNGPLPHPGGDVQVFDETLRDGLQAAHVRHPNVEEKLHLLSLMDRLGIDQADIGFPSSDCQQSSDIVELGRIAAAGKLRLRLEVAGRCAPGDIRAILDVVERSGYTFEAGIFIGSSSIRRFVEGWDLSTLVGRVREGVALATRNGLRVMFVTEDTTRSDPETIRVLYDAAISEGATRLCVADTVGSATPRGVARLMSFIVREVIRGQPGLQLIWHGHRDLGLEIANCLAAVEGGAQALEATALGIGERAGNAAMELVLAHLHLNGLRSGSLLPLTEYAHYAARILRAPIPFRQPVVGPEAFSHGSGVHAAAIRKALELGRPDLAGVVYSPIDPAVVKRTIGITVGRMSGRSNAILALRNLGIEPAEGLVSAVLAAAKTSDSPLTNERIRQLAEAQSVAVLAGV
jgi:isopropylmalate/homocitrate/citramalate synthase